MPAEDVADQRGHRHVAFLRLVRQAVFERPRRLERLHHFVASVDFLSSHVSELLSYRSNNLANRFIKNIMRKKEPLWAPAALWTLEVRRIF